MSLLKLPPELRLRVYDHIYDLSSEGLVSIVPSSTSLTPPICRVNRLLRLEAMPLYAQNSRFSIDLTSSDSATRDRIRNWTTALGSTLPRVTELRLSRSWDIFQPMRGQGHVGFYLTLNRKCSKPDDDRWQGHVGTYPVYQDLRGMRLESAELLQHLVLDILNRVPSGTKSDIGMDAGDVELIVTAMDVIAAHPISTYDLDQSDIGRRRRRQIWERMLRQLHVLTSVRLNDTGHENGSSTFHTPY